MPGLSSRKQWAGPVHWRQQQSSSRQCETIDKDYSPQQLKTKETVGGRPPTKKKNHAFPPRRGSPLSLQRRRRSRSSAPSLSLPGARGSIPFAPARLTTEVRPQTATPSVLPAFPGRRIVVGARFLACLTVPSGLPDA